MVANIMMTTLDSFPKLMEGLKINLIIWKVQISACYDFENNNTEF